MSKATSGARGWRSAVLGALVDIKSGATPFKGESDYWGGDIPWVTAKDLKVRKIENSIIHLTARGAERVKCVDAGAILILVRGMTLHRDVPIAITARRVSFNQDIKALIPRNGLLPAFLLNCLLSQKRLLLDSVESAGHGTGRLDTEYLRSLPILVPPMVE